jgi:hypothetical protein
MHTIWTGLMPSCSIYFINIPVFAVAFFLLINDFQHLAIHTMCAGLDLYIFSTSLSDYGKPQDFMNIFLESLHQKIIPEQHVSNDLDFRRRFFFLAYLTQNPLLCACNNTPCKYETKCFTVCTNQYSVLWSDDKVTCGGLGIKCQLNASIKLLVRQTKKE